MDSLSKRQCTIDSFLAKRRRNEDPVNGTIIISDKDADLEFDEDEREVETVESAQQVNGTGTSRVFMCTATDFIGFESEQSDSDDCSGNDTDLSSEARPEDTEGIEEIIPAVDQAQGS